MGINNIRVEYSNGKYYLAYEPTEETMVCFGDNDWCANKTEIRNILLSVIEEFNKMNPNYKIDVLREVVV